MKILTAVKDALGYHYDIEVAADDVRHFDWGADVPEAAQMREMALLCQPPPVTASVTLDKLIGKELPAAK